MLQNSYIRSNIMNVAWKKRFTHHKMPTSIFAHGCDVTSMSLVGSRMAIAHSFTHSLAHSILINLFIKLELGNFLLPPVLSIAFVQECSVVLRKVWWGETRKAYIFVESLGKSLSSASEIEAGHYGFHVVLFRKYDVFDYRLLLKRRWKLVEVFMTLMMYRSQ